MVYNTTTFFLAYKRRHIMNIQYYLMSWLVEMLMDDDEFSFYYDFWVMPPETKRQECALQCALIDWRSSILVDKKEIWLKDFMKLCEILFSLTYEILQWILCFIVLFFCQSFTFISKHLYYVKHEVFFIIRIGFTVHITESQIW